MHFYITFLSFCRMLILFYCISSYSYAIIMANHPIYLNQIGTLNPTGHNAANIKLGCNPKYSQGRRPASACDGGPDAPLIWWGVSFPSEVNGKKEFCGEEDWTRASAHILSYHPHFFCSLPFHPPFKNSECGKEEKQWKWVGGQRWAFPCDVTLSVSFMDGRIWLTRQ